MSLYRDRDKSEAKAMRAIAKVRAANKEIKRLSAEIETKELARKAALKTIDSLTASKAALSAENADAQAKEAFALGKLEETLKIESELRAENKRLEALDKDWLRASEQWADENSLLEKRSRAMSLKAELIEKRYLPCPDHRDKHQTGDECLMCQLERANARERKAFAAGMIALVDHVAGALEKAADIDPEQAWQQYRCQDDSDWRAARGVLAEPERVSTEPAPDGINDRGSDEYANPERDGDRQTPGETK